MGFKIALALCVMVAIASAVPGSAGPGGAWGGWGGAGAWGGPGAGAGGAWGGWGAPAAWGGPGAGAGGGAPAANPWIPPWISTAPWFPQWGPCTMIGSTCLDCNTKMVCTKVGGLQRPCSDPTLPHCNLGECSATPSDACAVTTTPADVAE